MKNREKYSTPEKKSVLDNFGKEGLESGDRVQDAAQERLYHLGYDEYEAAVLAWEIRRRYDQQIVKKGRLAENPRGYGLRAAKNMRLDALRAQIRRRAIAEKEMEKHLEQSARQQNIEEDARRRSMMQEIVVMVNEMISEHVGKERAQTVMQYLVGELDGTAGGKELGISKKRMANIAYQLRVHLAETISRRVEGTELEAVWREFDPSRGV